MLNKPLDLTNHRDKRVLLFEFWYTNNQSSSQKSRNRSMIVKWAIWWKNYIKIIEYYVKLWKSNFFSFFEQRRLELKNSDNSEKKKEKKIRNFSRNFIRKIKSKGRGYHRQRFRDILKLLPLLVTRIRRKCLDKRKMLPLIKQHVVLINWLYYIYSNIADLYKCVGHKLGSPSW